MTPTCEHKWKPIKEAEVGKPEISWCYNCGTLRNVQLGRKTGYWIPKCRKPKRKAV